jgi:hypothetical protein
MDALIPFTTSGSLVDCVDSESCLFFPCDQGGAVRRRRGDAWTNGVGRRWCVFVSRT